MTVWRMRIAYLIPKATNTHSEYVIFLVFPLQQWLRERASMLRCTYIACLVRRHFSMYINVRLSYFNALEIIFILTRALFLTKRRGTLLRVRDF